MPLASATMSLASALMPEFELEMGNTRKVLERVPEDRLGWKPHEKSMTMAELATHIASMPGWVTPTFKTNFMDMSAPDAPPPPKPVASRNELLALFDKSVEEAKALLSNVSDDQMKENWSLRMGEKTLFTLPRTAVMRSFILNHHIHHRGQLEVYLRLNNVPLPAIYGPSADENTF